MSNGLDVLLVKDPFGEGSENDKSTEIEFSSFEWESFFFRTLGVTVTEFFPGETFVDYETRRVRKFRETLSNYPLLSRIDEFYQDAGFTADEVPFLREELRRVENLELDAEGRAFLDGMVKACDLASDSNLGIFLSSS